jgi:two-component system, NtrC family, sensor histidine kinase HydH
MNPTTATVTPSAADSAKDPIPARRPKEAPRAAPAKARPTFNLIRWFSILSFASIALVSIVSSSVLSKFISRELVKRDAMVTMEVIQSVCEAEHASAFFLNPSDPTNDPGLKEFFNHIGSLPDVLRANVYGRDKTMLWSTEKRLVGQRFGANEDLDEALEGKISLETGITGREQNPKQEHKFLDDRPVHFVETYIPLRNPDTKQVIGVVELYRIPRTVFETIASGQRLIWTFALLGGLFLYVTMFGIVYRGDRIIRTQQDRLVESETMSALGEMASAVAHGIRNPLASIRSSAELSLCEKGLTCCGCSNDIINEVDRLEGWLRDLLTYSQPEHGTLEQVSLPEVVRRSLEAFTRETSRRGIAVAVDVPAALPRVQADEALLGQVLNSVVANALDAMPQAGSLSVRAESDSWRRQIKLTIADTGIGIPAERIEQVFTPFHTSKPKGMGVGLSLARRIIRRFGGDITIKSREGDGTTVIIQLLMAR